MTLRGNSGRLVQGVNNLSGFVKLIEGPGIEMIPNNAKNSLQFGTVTAMLEFDDILANGDSTARSAKFLNNASDTIPALIVHNTLDFGNGAVAPGVTLKYSSGTPDGLVIGPTTGTDKKILRTDLLGANTSTTIAVKSGMTFDTGLTLTVDNLVAQNVSNNGDITAHRLLPYDTTGLTINLDTCTMTCADTVTDPRVNIYPGLNCYGAITGSAGLALTGDLVLNNMITTPTLIVPIDLTLKPSGDVRIFSGKTLFCDILSQNNTNSNFNITAVGTNKNINIFPSGTGRTYFSGGVMMGYISNNYGQNITIQPDAGQINLLTNVNAANITATNITTPANTNLLLAPGTNGTTNVNSVLIVRDGLTVNTITTPATNTNLAISANGTGIINLNSPVVGTNITATNILTAANTNLNITPGTSGSTNINSVLIVRDGLTVNTITTPATNTNLAISANGTGTINLNSPVVGSTITATTFTAPPSSNININALGGSIITNAIRLAPTTSLTIAPTTSLTFTPGSPAQFNCTVNVANDLNITGSLNAAGLRNTTTNGNLALAANGTGTINLNSPTVGTTITATTFTAPPLSNLNINAAGGSILSNALNWSATGALGINSGGTMTLWPINNQCIIDATLTVNRSIIGSRFVGTEFVSNVLNTGISLSPNGTGQVNVLAGKTLTADTISSTTANTNLILTPNGTGSQVQIAAGKTLATDAISSNAATAIAIKNDMTFDATKILTVDNIISKSISNNGNIVVSKLIKNIGDGLTIDLDNSTITCTDATLPILIEPHVQINGTLTCTSNAIIYNGLATTTLTPYNSTGLTINLNNSTLSSATPISMGSIVANTISSAAATNLTINTPGGTINTNATNITASGALSLASNGTLNLQAFTGNSSINISASGSGVVNMLSPLLVNTIIPYNSANLSLAASGTNRNVSLTATGTGSIRCNSPLTATTITSIGLSNLTINAAGGTINTNATNITASGALTLATTNARLTLNAGTDIVITPLTGIITLSTNNANNININPGGLTSFGGSGIKLPNGGNTLNWYEEATLSSAWVNVVTDTPTNTTTLYVVRIGKQVFITLVSNNPIMPTTDIGVPTMQTNLVSKYSPVATFTQFNGSSYSIQISTAGVITLGNFVNTVAITPIMNFSYFTNN